MDDQAKAALDRDLLNLPRSLREEVAETGAQRADNSDLRARLLKAAEVRVYGYGTDR